MKHFKIFSQLFYGNEVNLNKPLKKKERNLESRDQFYLFLILKNTFVYFYFISIKASIRNVEDCMMIPLGIHFKVWMVHWGFIGLLEDLLGF